MPETMDKSTENKYEWFSKQINEAMGYFRKDVRVLQGLTKLSPTDTNELGAFITFCGGIRADIEQLEAILARAEREFEAAEEEELFNAAFGDPDDFDFNGLEFIEC